MKANFSRHIAALDEETLREELREIYQRFDNVKDYYRMELSGDTSKVLEKYKKKIYSHFFRGRGKRARSESRALIKDFQQASIFATDVLELNVYRTEMMVKWIYKHYNESDAYFKSLETSYNLCCKHTKDQQLEEEYQERLRLLGHQYQNYRRRAGRSLLPIYLRYFD